MSVDLASVPIRSPRAVGGRPENPARFDARPASFLETV